MIFNWCASRIFKACNIWLFSQGHQPLYHSGCLPPPKRPPPTKQQPPRCEWIKIIPIFALTSVAQLTGRHSAKKRLLLQFLASGLGSRLGCAQDTTNRCLSLSFSLPSLSLKINILVVAGVAQWTECQPANRRVAGWFPVRAHACGAGQVPSWGNERQPIDVSLVHISVSLPPPAK